MKKISYKQLQHMPDGIFVLINDVLCRKEPDGVTYSSWYGSTEFCSWETLEKRKGSLTIIL